jgi:O-antigen/teichoic acid export membrane protein
VTAFIVQKILIMKLGSDYNGINGLFTSVISMMSLTDLGIGSAIIYHLYRPAAEADYDIICSLLRFYRNSYLIISIIVLIIGCVLMVFIPGIVGNVVINDNIYLIFLLFLFDCLVSYFLSYKKSLLYAYQLNFVLDGIHFIYYILQNVAQIFVLVYYQSFILFLLLKTICKIIENITISGYIKKHYTFTRNKRVQPLTNDIRHDIFKKIKALLFHRLGRLLVTGSDSLVITGVLGILQMSLYTNYHLIIGGITALLNKVFETLTSSVGNFLLDSSKSQRYEIYRKIDFLNFWFFGCVSVILYSVMQPFVTLWVGEDYLFHNTTLFFLVINFYQEGMRASILTFKDAAGIYHEDRFIPVIEATINVIISMVLAFRIGITGVFVGTIVSSGVVYFYSYPKYVCKPLFNMSCWDYIRQTLEHMIMVILCMCSVQFVIFILPVRNLLVVLVLSTFISIGIFHIYMIAFWGRSGELKYFWSMFLKLIKRQKEE